MFNKTNRDKNSDGGEHQKYHLLRASFTCSYNGSSGGGMAEQRQAGENGLRRLRSMAFLFLFSNKHRSKNEPPTAAASLTDLQIERRIVHWRRQRPSQKHDSHDDNQRRDNPGRVSKMSSRKKRNKKKREDERTQQEERW